MIHWDPAGSGGAPADSPFRPKKEKKGLSWPGRRQPWSWPHTQGTAQSFPRTSQRPKTAWWWALFWERPRKKLLGPGLLSATMDGWVPVPPEMLPAPQSPRTSSFCCHRAPGLSIESTLGSLPQGWRSGQWQPQAFCLRSSHHY